MAVFRYLERLSAKKKKGMKYEKGLTLGKTNPLSLSIDTEDGFCWHF